MNNIFILLYINYEFSLKAENTDMQTNLIIDETK